MEAFPAFFPLSGRRVVIAGEGEGAETKARLLAGSPAKVDRLTGEAALRRESYDGAQLVFVASPDAAFRKGAAEAARAAGAAVNVVDDPALSDFHSPAIIDRGQVVAAIGTAGAAPIVAALVRAELEARLPEGLGRMAQLFGKLQDEIRAAYPDLARRRAFLRSALEGPAAEAADRGDMAAAEQRLRAAIGAGAEAMGRISLIVAPDERDLLSLRAARRLAIADVLVLGEGLAAGLDVLARRDAHRRALAETQGAELAALCAAQQVAVIARDAEILSLAGELAALGAHCDVLR